MPTSAARIGYKNLLRNGTVVASSEAAGFPVANIYNWRESDFFKPAASGTINITLTLSVADSADYFAFYSQDLFNNGGTIKLQYHNGSIYVDCFSAITPIDNTPRFVSFTSQTATLWRVVITCTSVFSIGVVAFGAQMALEYGMYKDWTPPVLARTARKIASISDSGSFLGSSVLSTGILTSIILQGASDAWVRSTWIPFVRHAEAGTPFFFIPNLTKYPLEATFCWVDGDMPQPTQNNFRYMGATIPIRGKIE